MKSATPKKIPRLPRKITKFITLRHRREPIDRPPPVPRLPVLKNVETGMLVLSAAGFLLFFGE